MLLYLLYKRNFLLVIYDLFFYMIFFTFLPIVETLVSMGYNRQEIEDSLAQTRYDDVFATYLLLGRKNTDVS